MTISMAPPPSAESARLSSPAPHPEPPSLRQLETLFHAHYAPLCEYVWQYVASRELAEEVVQSLFVRLWELQARGSSPSLSVAYLYTAARNRAIGHLRRERVARRFADEAAAAYEATPSAETVADTVHARDLARAAERAVMALPDRCRLIFLMSRQQGLSYSEIAQALSISVTTVETQISRALKSLRAQLAPYLGVAIVLAHGVSSVLRAVR